MSVFVSASQRFLSCLWFKPPGAPANVGGEMQGSPGGQQGSPAGKPGGVLMDMEQMKAQQSQAQIETLDHVT